MNQGRRVARSTAWAADDQARNAALERIADALEAMAAASAPVVLLDWPATDEEAAS